MFDRRNFAKSILGMLGLGSCWSDVDEGEDDVIFKSYVTKYPASKELYILLGTPGDTGDSARQRVRDHLIETFDKSLPELYKHVAVLKREEREARGA